MSSGLPAKLYYGNKLVGRMILREAPEDCIMELKDGMDFPQVPPEVYREYMDHGARRFTGEPVHEFICSRVEPPGRMNIGQILDDMGLVQYDPVAMFIWHKGRCCMDKFRIELVEG